MKLTGKMLRENRQGISKMSLLKKPEETRTSLSSWQQVFLRETPMNTKMI